jgi:hypothetical protein
VRVVDARAQLHGPVRHFEILQRPADVSRAEAEQLARPRVGHEELAARVGDELCGRVLVEGNLAQAI